MSPKNGKQETKSDSPFDRVKPLLHQRGKEIQPYGKVVGTPIGLDEKVRADSVANLNQILADTMTLRDMYKKHH